MSPPPDRVVLSVKLPPLGATGTSRHMRGTSTCAAFDATVGTVGRSSALGQNSADGPMAIRSLGGAAMTSATSPARCDPTTEGLAPGRALAAGGGATAGGGVSCGSSENFSAKFSATFPREVTRAVSAGSLSRGSAISNRADARSGPFLGDFAGPPLARRPASATCTAARLRASRRCVRARPSPPNWPVGQGVGLGSSPLLGGGVRRI